MVLESRVKSMINDTLNDYCNPFVRIRCPKCGYMFSNIVNVQSLSTEETQTRQGGYIIEIEFECEHPNVAYVFAEHKGEIVCGKLIENGKRRYDAKIDFGDCV